MKKLLALTIIVVMSIGMMVGCTNLEYDGLSSGYDVSLPKLEKDGWYATMIDEFDGEKLNEDIWTTSPHKVRWKTQVEGQDNYTSYWCPDTVKVSGGMVEISAFETTTHNCSSGVCPSVGRFSGGIETRKEVPKTEGNGFTDQQLFSQAFGYFETRVKFPNAEGLWSAFWLQSVNQRKVGSEGLDGTEIDIYESAFIRDPQKMGHALLWDGYGKHAKVNDYILDTGKNLYDGFHTYALKWTPEYYVFFIDGKPTYLTSAGGVSRVKEFLRLTIEIDAGDQYGPHGKKIGSFKDNTSKFLIDYVKVYQNKNYEKFIIKDSQFPGGLDAAN